MFTITNVTIYPVDNCGTLKAFASVEFDEALVVKGVKVIEGIKGLFVSMPSRQGDDGKYYDDVYPITKEARDELNDGVLSCYEEVTAQEKPKTAPKKSYKKK